MYDTGRHVKRLRPATYPGTVVDELLEVFVLAEDWFSDEMIKLNTQDWNQRHCVHLGQPRDLLSLLVILRRRHKTEDLI